MGPIWHLKVQKSSLDEHIVSSLPPWKVPLSVPAEVCAREGADLRLICAVAPEAHEHPIGIHRKHLCPDAGVAHMARPILSRHHPTHHHLHAHEYLLIDLCIQIMQECTRKATHHECSGGHGHY